MGVAPHWGAWIEIYGIEYADEKLASHPTGVRGLKWLLGGGLECAPKSHPTGVRGLKYDGYSLLLMVAMVAPHWGAWIEI